MSCSPEHPTFCACYSNQPDMLFSQHMACAHTQQAYLQEEGYNLSSHNTLLSGASAGALSATLAKTEVNPYDATALALSMSDDAGIWDRPSGLQGVWGNIIRDWLDRLLPDDAEERAEDGVRVFYSCLCALLHVSILGHQHHDGPISIHLIHLMHHLMQNINFVLP